jgi:hypothetical protein
MKKIAIFLSTIALLMPLSLEAKTPDALVLEERKFPEPKTSFLLQAKDDNWSLQAGALRLRAKKEAKLRHVVVGPDQKKESSPRFGIAFIFKF